MVVGKLFIISASSGVGKTSLTSALVDRLQPVHGLKRAITYTTKKPRDGEKDGIDYHFLTEEAFIAKIEQNYFVEYSTVYGAYYGFPRYVLEEVDKGSNYIAILDYTGVLALKQHKPDSVCIWLNPPDRKTLSQRLESRGLDDAATISRRLSIAEQEREIAKDESIFHYVVVNDDFSNTLDELEGLVKQMLLHEELA